jgi:hemoglobin
VRRARPEAPRPSGSTWSRHNHEEMDRRAITCFDQAMNDAGLDEAGPLRKVLHDYFAWATTTTMSRYHESADQVPEDMSIPRWSWDGLQR